jgi:Carboxypeptidase regulatory-like domain
MKKYLLVLVVLLLPATVFAQASLTGTVHDPSGAILPGVTVEASSPALIEKTREAVTDGSGQYRIINLQPGTYALTFTLTGFNTVKRENILLSGSMVVTIPVEMKVGGIEETITVTGETPVVDVQSAKREIVMNQQVIQTLPVTRAAGALLNAVPGLQVDTNGPALAPTMTFFNAHSSTINSNFVAGEGRYTVNGFPVSAARSGGPSSYVYDTANAQEIGVSVGGGIGESDNGGPAMNIVPKAGGNLFKGSAFISSAGTWSSGNNLSSRHYQCVRLERRLRRADRQGPSLVLRFVPRARHADGAGRHRGQHKRRERGALGLGRRQLDDHASCPGSADAHRPHHGAGRQESLVVQLGVPASLRRHAADRRRHRLP